MFLPQTPVKQPSTPTSTTSGLLAPTQGAVLPAAPRTPLDVTWRSDVAWAAQQPTTPIACALPVKGTFASSLPPTPPNGRAVLVRSHYTGNAGTAHVAAAAMPMQTTHVLHRATTTGHSVPFVHKTPAPVPVGNVLNAKGEVSNSIPLKRPQEPTLLDNTQLFLPKAVVDELGLEPNMDDKDDEVKELWWGRLWELIALLGAKYRHTTISRTQPLSHARAAELDRICQDPLYRPKLKKMAARWHGASIRARCSLKVLDAAKFCGVRGTLVYCHGSGGNSWDNMRICRMVSRMGVIVIVPDGFAYPLDSPMGKLRHKDLQPLKRANDDVDYWAGDLMYASDATGDLTYSTKAESVLEDPDHYRSLYEKSFQLRRNELHFILERLPGWIKAHGVFLGGTSEGAMTISRFDDQRYGSMIIGRFINSFSIEYCYFTPNPEDGQIGGQLEVPTLNIIGTRDQFFGPSDSVAKVVTEDGDTGYGDKVLDGHGFPQLVKQGVNRGLVCIFEDGVHSPCETHDNFLRPLFDLFFRRACDIWEIDRIWVHDPYLSSLLEVTERHVTPLCKVTRIFCPTMHYPQKKGMKQISRLVKLKGGNDEMVQMLKEEEAKKQAQQQEVHSMLGRIRDDRARNKRMPSANSFSSKIKNTLLQSHHK